MKKTATIIFIFALLISDTILAGTAQFYTNTFDGPEDLNTIVGGESISVESGQLKAEITSESGDVILVLNSNSFTPAYHSIVSENDGVVTWSFNLSNEDGLFNNSFYFVLLSTEEDPFDIGAQGYYFGGGGVPGDRMGLWRFDFGLDGSQDVLVDIVNGLGTLPDKGSFKITYNPDTNEWTLFGEIAQEYVDPAAVNNFLGSAIDSTYTNITAPYIGMGGKTSGAVYFDNILMTVEDITSPTVTSSNPENDWTHVGIFPTITVTFSEFMNAATITSSSFFVNDGVLNIDGTISCDELVAEFVPTYVLESDTTYTVTVTTDATDMAGNSMQNDYKFSFKTVDISGIGIDTGNISISDSDIGVPIGGCFISTAVGDSNKRFQ